MKKQVDKRRKGSMLIVSLIFATLLLHAAMEAAPLYAKIKDRSLKKEQTYREQRINEAIVRFHKKHGCYPTKLESLTRFKFIPRLYDNPCSPDSSWRIEKTNRDRIVSVSSP